MLNVKTGEQLSQKKDLCDLVKERMTDLKYVVGDTMLDVTAEWELAQDSKGQDMVTLRLSELNGHETGVFSSDELKSASVIRSRAFRLWGGLLQQYTGRLLRQLLDDRRGADNGD